MGASDTNLDIKTWCLTPTETIRLNRVGAKMGGRGGGGGGMEVGEERGSGRGLAVRR